MTHNELVFGLTMLVSIALCLISFKLGRRWVEAYILTAVTVLQMINSVFLEVAGYVVVIGLPIYAGIFLATDMLSERYGKETALRMVYISTATIVMLQMLLQIALLIEPPIAHVESFEAFEMLAASSLRISIFGILAHFIAQTFDVKFYHYLHQKLGENHLWIRNNLSTITAQFVNSVIFFGGAFYGVVEGLWTLIIISFFVKSAIAVVDTPFMYLSKKITPLDMADAEKLGRVYKMEK